MKNTFELVTEKTLSNTKCKWYGGGTELKINDKVCFGFTMNFANLSGIPPSNYNPDQTTLSLKMFVEQGGMLYELYKKKGKIKKF
ncbi:MAG: hypothetical protein M0R17_12005 [Candidatus Omnitrophica bacterium]|jgi:hypothetical protein|nr:hypothetical protein [Candidatus Omnitrophota bacterium]